MKKQIFTLAAAAAAFLAWSCTSDITEAVENPVTIEDGPEYIYISLGGDQQTKTTYEYEGGRLKTYWKAGDIVAETPACIARYAVLYEAQGEGENTGVFKKISGLSYTSDVYGIYYPGDRIRSDVQFNNFSYKGQVQSKDDPTGHLAAFHTIMSHVEDFPAGSTEIATIDLSGATQSACMRFLLSGMEFVNPKQISLVCLRGGIPYNGFLQNNCLYQWHYSDGETRQSPTKVSQLDLELTGYGTESFIEAFMMMSNEDVLLNAGDVIRVQVTTDDGIFYSDTAIESAMTLTGGRCHTLTANSGWQALEGDYTDYDYEGEVVTIQKGLDGLDIILMGDGFIAEDFEDGTYDRVMRKAADMFFTCQPYESFKDIFHVAYVKAVSPQRIDATSTFNGAANGTAITKFHTSFTPNSTSVNGDSDLAIQYAGYALGTNASERIKDATIIVVANFRTHAGTCHSFWETGSLNANDYGKCVSVSFFPLGNSDEHLEQIMHHEAGGHGFGKLADEYVSSTATNLSTSLWYELDNYHTHGMYRNADKYIDDNLFQQVGDNFDLTTKANVYWHDLFDTPNNYESPEVESLGIYKGGYTYSSGFCRPTENAARSIMNGNTGIFNAISRRQIFYRICRLAGYASDNQYGSAEELQRFLDWDADEFLPAPGTARHAAQSLEPDKVRIESVPLGTPVVHTGHWDNGRFIED